MKQKRGRLVAVATIVGASLLGMRGIEAHKGITSKYTYNDDVYPILRDKCGRCHVDGGPAPMSLLTYDPQSGAVAWAESIRENLVAEAMPPWYVDPAGPAVRGGHTLSPRELDVIVTWATGGTPHGDLRKEPKPMKAHVTWSLGQPDLTLPFPKDATIGPGVMEASQEFSIPNPGTETRWLKAIDILPGTPSIVRSATVAIDHGPVLSVWEPGGDVVGAPAGTAFKLAPGATLLVNVRYKKSYLDEQQTKTDRSTLGLYFVEAPAKEIQSFNMPGPQEPGTGRAAVTFGAVLDRSGRVLAVRPSVDKAYEVMNIDAVSASGRTPLLKLRGIRPEWPRRYWLMNPATLASGTRIEVSGTPADPDSGPLAAPIKSPLQVALDYVPQP